MADIQKRGSTAKAQGQPKKIMNSSPAFSDKTLGSKSYCATQSRGAATSKNSYPAHLFSSREAYEKALSFAADKIERGEVANREPQMD